MAAALLQSLIKNHPFIDGNKRTAFFSTLRFLNINKINLKISNDEIVQFAIEVDTKNKTIDQIAKWLKSKSTKNNSKLSQKFFVSRCVRR